MAASRGDTLLELDRLSVAYYRAPVVRDLTLTVGRGEVVALLGANGAGKTTTLRTISGLLKPAGGAVRLCGQDLAGVSPTARARLGLAHVPHDRGIFFGLTVAEHFRLDGLVGQAESVVSSHGGSSWWVNRHGIADDRAVFLPPGNAWCSQIRH